MSPKPLPHQGRTIEEELRTTATPQQVYEAWADPEKISQWFTDEARGEAKEGEIVTWIFKAFGYEIPYKVVAAEPGEQFAVLFETPDRSGLLEIRIEKEGGETVMRLVNSGFKEGEGWDEEYEGIASGWRMGLGVLKHYLEHHFGEKKTNLLLLRPAEFDWDRLHHLFHDEMGLASWLTRSGAPGGVGDSSALAMKEAPDLEGPVLADTGRELTLAWPQVGGVLEMKGFSGQGGKMCGLRVTLWNPDEELPAKLEKDLGPAVEALAREAARD